MEDERAFIARVEAAGTEEFARILSAPDADEDRALKAYFGEERYRRMRNLVLKQSATRSLTFPRKLGNIVVLPGIMGSDLSLFNASGGSEHLWVSIPHIALGAIRRLRLANDGRSGFELDWDVRPTGISKRAYGEMLLYLRANWNVHPIFYDWRKDLSLAATHLESQIGHLFPEGTPVHIVAHSMGGLVARTFIKKYPERWAAMRGQGGQGSKLIMLGTPNHGSFAIPQVITGLETLVKLIDLLDLRHTRAELLQVLNSFPGNYQMLPSPLEMDGVERLYRSDTYGELNVPQSHLDRAKAHHEWLRDVVDPQRMYYIAGTRRPTYSSITDWDKFLSPDENAALGAYEVTYAGDGRVPHALGKLVSPQHGEVTTYYVEEDHGDLASNSDVMMAIEDLLVEGKVEERAEGGLTKQPFAHRGLAVGEQPVEVADKKAGAHELAQQREADVRKFEALIVQRGARRATPATPDYVSKEEREMEELLTRNFLNDCNDEQLKRELEKMIEMPLWEVRIRLVRGEIQNVHRHHEGLDDPVDAISVGHYKGVLPEGPELDIDRAISEHLPSKEESKPGDRARPGSLILTQYAQRGILTGDLGQPFFLEDPRPDDEGPPPRTAGGGRRIIAIAGMGEPGRFGEPELSVMARELCWAVGRMGKRHLATVLIGTGRGNLTLRPAVEGWIRGIKNAVTGAVEDEKRHVKCVTFVVRDGRKMREVQNAIIEQRDYLLGRKRLKINYTPYSEEQLLDFEREAHEEERKRVLRDLKARASGGPAARDAMGVEGPSPACVTFELRGNVYRFGAITSNASVPERDIVLDPNLVRRANDELAAEHHLERQQERGQFMWELLIPDDIGERLQTNGPLVMLLDSSMARVHWEIVAQPDRVLDPRTGAAQHDDGSGNRANKEKEEILRSFLGISRGFTRRLRSTFAPPPEPPPPPQRRMRVLVVADPAADARLPGAEAEGAHVADLFESYNRLYKGIPENRNRIEVVRLIGPFEATRTTVLRELTLRTYDVLHFAGHCKFNPENRSDSGWIFSNKELLTANELTRIDRVPKFIFSNACESGVTLDRSEARNADLAPSFAEQFFERGVSNFVCTAWPVDDLSARQFALTLYSALLGIEVPPGREGQEQYYKIASPQPMHEAMRAARWAIACPPDTHPVRGAGGGEAADAGDTRDTLYRPYAPYGALTWGAYQHYGDPYLYFFDESQYKDKLEKAKADRADSAARETDASEGTGASRRVEAGSAGAGQA